MVEFQKQVAKEGAQTADAKYMGLDKEPTSGEKNGKAWRHIKTRWLIDGRKNENKFDIWTDLGDKSQYKNESQLVQFGRYRIVWYEKNEARNGQEWISKTIQIIKDTDTPEPQVQQQAQPQQQPTGNVSSPAPTKERTPQDWVNFANEYNQKYKGSGKDNAGHMLATYILNRHKDEFASVITLCRKNFGQ